VFLETYLPILADIADFVSYANDILSFYKETMVEDEDMNYICNLARARQITVLDALRVASDKALQCVRTIRAFLGQANGQGILDTTEQFIQAYVGRHVVEARYKLSDLDIEILRMEG
jgi:predicted ATP-dependent protease